ncbi:MAG: SH3 domain-containing protein, partial [Candidatus Marinimicrobia bacterium]|nr:SH3 domain-containing protein [Candidatus Neomarinimicrobiota bacterium]
MSVLIKAILFNNFIIFGLTVNLIYAQTSSLPYGTVVRTGAGSFYPVIKIIDKPESMTVLRKQEGWVEIKLDTGKSGWISENVLRNDRDEGDYLKRLKESKENVKVTQAIIVSAVKGFGDRYREAIAEGNSNILALDRQLITPQMWYDFVK